MVGNIPNFVSMDILRCFLKLNKNSGRQELANELSLGEGTIRSILEVLKSKSLLDSTKKGHFLSKRGNELQSRILSQITPLKGFEMKEFYPEFQKIGIVVRKPNVNLATYKLRDIAVKNGAEGALILKYGKRLEAPEDYYQDYFKKLEGIFKVEKGDILIVSFAENERQAQIGALAIANQLSSEIRNFAKEVQ